ncbi:hypothetical protein BDN67DRAFT_1069730 [Paxillus ammoniavirescens]|nr:hypothetical protein BDN67DRAFT_1069730 [Paxillus ammoniavirescens]
MQFTQRGADSGYCMVCGQLTDRRCPRCLELWYCSPEHQESGWQTHKSTCNPHNEIKGIYFAAGESSPRLITVTLEYNHIPDPYSLATDVIKIPVLQPLLGDGDYDGLPITHQGKAGKELKRPFRLFIRDNFLNDKSPPNHIPANLTKGKAPHQWAGNLLALKEESRGSSQWKNCSINEDLPNLVKFFEWYGVKPTEAEIQAQLRELFGEHAGKATVICL